MTEDSTGPSGGDALQTIFYRAEQVRFVYWDRFSSAKATVALVGVIAIITFITGLSTMSQEELILDGPLAHVVPEVTEFVRFGGVLASFVLGGAAYGLHRRKRVAWVVAVVILPFVGSLPLLSLQSTHIPLLLLILIALPLLVLNREQFSEGLDLSSLQIAALSSIVGVLAYGTIGSYVTRDQFVNLETWTDAMYYVLVTIATVGYGDITPTTTEAKWFSLSVIIFGVAAFTTAIGALIVPAIEKRMASAFGNMTPSSLALLEDHVIVLGYSEITEAVLEELADVTDLVVITPDPNVAAQLDDADVNVLTADPTNVDTLRDAGVEFAQGVIAGTDDDAQDVLAILATREVNPDIRIVAAANEAHNAEKLKRVGADHVISPSMIGGILLGRSVLTDAVPDEVVSDILPDNTLGEDEPADSDE